MSKRPADAVELVLECDAKRPKTDEEGEEKLKTYTVRCQIYAYGDVTVRARSKSDAIDEVGNMDTETFLAEGGFGTRLNGNYELYELQTDDVELVEGEDEEEDEEEEESKVVRDCDYCAEEKHDDVGGDPYSSGSDKWYCSECLALVTSCYKCDTFLMHGSRKCDVFYREGWKREYCEGCFPDVCREEDFNEKYNSFDKDDVLEAVKEDGYVLEYASDALKGDRDVVLAAVEQCGGALEYASDALKGDREVVTAAMEQDRTALQYATPTLREEFEKKRNVLFNDLFGSSQDIASSQESVE